MRRANLVVIAATPARAREIGERLGAVAFWPRTPGDMAGRERLPVYLDWSWTSHPRSEDLAGVFQARQTGRVSPAAAWRRGLTTP